jgi:trehalose 6-phosphate phosphatase
MASLKPLWLSVSSLSEQLCRAESLHVGLDFDGTLTPISADPREAALPARTREVIEHLSRQDGVRMAILSSRTLRELWRRVGLEGIYYAGSSGLETQDGQGHHETHAGATISLPMPLLRDLEGWCQRFPGALLETRISSCALYFSGVTPSLQPAFGAGLRRRVRPFQSEVALVHGRTGFEVMPQGGWDKAAALERWLGPASAATETVLFYFGDDTRDEPVHAAVRRRGGHAVAVDRIVSHAEYSLPTPGDVTWFLEWLDREWSLRAAPEVRAEQDRLETSTP